ncbi:MAG: alginate lyase family protein [Acidobacteriota bacterium]
MKKIQQFNHLWRHFGTDWLAFRLAYATRLKIGALRRKLPATHWHEQPLSKFLSDVKLADPEGYFEYRRLRAPGFFFDCENRQAFQSHFAGWDSAAVITPLELSARLERGELRYFEHTFAAAGFPPDWHRNPFTGQRAPVDLHWSAIGDFDYGDIKIIWEPSRFAFAYPLTRSYWRTGDDVHAERFWQAFEDWRAHNPPQLGVNWKCGQETAFRVMAWCFALYGLFDAPATTASRVAQLAQAIAVSGERIAANLDYALSQKNNHGISEAVGIFTIGTLFPEFREAASWQAKGREVLESQARELIYEDGAFSQHSLNYERLMLHDYLWAVRLGEIIGAPFSDELQTKLCAATNFLYQLQDETTGRLPNYGHNDGALVLPLNNSDYQDFRPLIQAMNYLTEKTRCYESGAWDEDLLWLFGEDALKSPVRQKTREDLQAAHSGYYTLRAQESFVFTGCGEFAHRPAQADLLHMDLWWRGQNIAMDAGTFSYHAPLPWDNALAHTAFHNTVTVDGFDQMNRAGKFLWLPWARGKCLHRCRSQAEHLACFEGTHNGFERLASPVGYRRAIAQLGECWLVVDELTAATDHQYRLHWLLADAPYEWNEQAKVMKLATAAGDYYLYLLTLEGNAEVSMVRADERSARGWCAPYYNDRQAALSVALTTCAKTVRWLSFFSPEPCSLENDESTLRVQSDNFQATVNWQTAERENNFRKPLIATLTIHGALKDRLEIG